MFRKSQGLGFSSSYGGAGPQSLRWLFVVFCLLLIYLFIYLLYLNGLPEDQFLGIDRKLNTSPRDEICEGYFLHPHRHKLHSIKKKN